MSAAASHSLVPPSYAGELDETERTGRFQQLEEPADDARKLLGKATQRLAEVIDRNLSAHARFCARLDALKEEWENSPRKALIVEDNKQLRFVLIRQFERLGFQQIHEAETYDTARELVQRHQYDIVLVDVRLQGGDVGLDVVTLIRAQSLRPLVPVVVMSGQDPDETAQMAAKKLSPEDLERGTAWSGANDFLMKPFSFEELKSTVERLLREARPRVGRK